MTILSELAKEISKHPFSELGFKVVYQDQKDRIHLTQRKDEAFFVYIITNKKGEVALSVYDKSVPFGEKHTDEQNKACGKKKNEVAIKLNSLTLSVKFPEFKREQAANPSMADIPPELLEFMPKESKQESDSDFPNFDE